MRRFWRVGSASWLLTMLCLTLIVFYLVNLEPNLKKLAISQTEMHASSEELESWLVKNGYRRPFLERYAAWLGRLAEAAQRRPRDRRRHAALLLLRRSRRRRRSPGVLEGDFGCSTKFKVKVAAKLGPALRGDRHPDVLGHGGHGPGRAASSASSRACARDRGSIASLSILSIATTSTPEYVSGRRAHHHLRDLARLAQRLGGVGDRGRASPSTISPCRSRRPRSTAWAMSRA